MRNDVNPTNILVRVPNWIGDAVMCLPALRDIREFFPNAHIVVLAGVKVSELLFKHEDMDGVIVYDHHGRHKGVLGLWKLSREISSKNFDLAVLFQGAFRAAMIAWLARIPNRIGYDRDGRGWLLSHRVPIPNLMGKPHSDYYRWLVQSITHKTIKPSNPTLHVSSQVQGNCERAFPELFSIENEVLVGINPGAAYGSAKCWLPQRFAEVGDELARQHSEDNPRGPFLRCVIFGGKGEEELGKAIANQMTHKAVVLSGKTTIQQLMGILTRCSVLVTNDTGPMHVAQALGVPVVAIFGSTDSSITGPMGQRFRIHTAGIRCSPCLLRSCPIDHRCMTTISSREVVDSARTLLSISLSRLPPSSGNGMPG